MQRYRTVIVTGGAGFIGTNLVLRLLDDGLTVVNLDKLTYAGQSAENIDSERYFFEEVDLALSADLPRIFATYKPDAVLHLAAESHVDRSIEGPEVFLESNVIGTFKLLQASLEYCRCENQSCSWFRFLQLSTDEVYGSLYKESKPFEESTPYDPRSPYSATKAAADHLVNAWHHTYGLPVLFAHSCNNFGPYQHREKLIPLVIEKCLAFESIPVYGDGQNIRDWIYVDDNVDAMLSLLNSGEIGEHYNIGGQCELENIELVRMICDLFDELRPLESLPFKKGSQVPATHKELITFVDDRPGHDFRYAMNATKIREELNWSPKHSFESALRKTVEWYLDRSA